MVGFIPTMPFTAAGQVIEPSVSVPIAAGTMPAATATALPELEPQGLRSSACGLRVWPPIALQPEIELDERKLAHSLRFVLPTDRKSVVSGKRVAVRVDPGGRRCIKKTQQQ